MLIKRDDTQRINHVITRFFHSAAVFSMIFIGGYRKNQRKITNEKKKKIIYSWGSIF